MNKDREKDKLAYDMINAGSRLKDVAAALGGVSTSVARMRAKSHESYLSQDGPFKELCTRTQNVLKNAGIETKEQLEDIFKQNDYSWVVFKKFKNFGATSYNELCDFVGHPEQKHCKEIASKVCPCCGQIIKAKQ